MKDIDLTNVRYWLEEFDELIMPHPNALGVDTSNSKPEETARKILKHVAAVGNR